MEHPAEFAEHGGPSPTEIAQQRALARLAEAFFDGDSVDLSIEASKAQAIASVTLDQVFQRTGIAVKR